MKSFLIIIFFLFNGLLLPHYLADATVELEGNWEREYAKAGDSCLNNKSGKENKRIVSYKIELSFTEDQFKINHSEVNDNTSEPVITEGKYAISGDTIKFYRHEDLIGTLVGTVRKDRLLLIETKESANFSSTNSDGLTLPGEYKRVRNNKGCGCGH